MSSTPSMVALIADALSGAGTIRTRKMFGEYGVYCDEVFIGVICDNTLFVKPTAAGRAYAPDLGLAPAYTGAKPSLRIPEGGLDDPAWLAGLVARTRDELG